MAADGQSDAEPRYDWSPPRTGMVHLAVEAAKDRKVKPTPRKLLPFLLALDPRKQVNDLDLFERKLSVLGSYLQRYRKDDERAKAAAAAEALTRSAVGDGAAHLPPTPAQEQQQQRQQQEDEAPPPSLSAGVVMMLEDHHQQQQHRHHEEDGVSDALVPAAAQGTTALPQAAAAAAAAAGLAAGAAAAAPAHLFEEGHGDDAESDLGRCFDIVDQQDEQDQQMQMQMSQLQVSQLQVSQMQDQNGAVAPQQPPRPSQPLPQNFWAQPQPPQHQQQHYGLPSPLQRTELPPQHQHQLLYGSPQPLAPTAAAAAAACTYRQQQQQQQAPPPSAPPAGGGQGAAPRFAAGAACPRAGLSIQVPPLAAGHDLCTPHDRGLQPGAARGPNFDQQQTPPQAQHWRPAPGAGAAPPALRLRSATQSPGPALGSPTPNRIMSAFRPARFSEPTLSPGPELGAAAVPGPGAAAAAAGGMQRAVEALRVIKSTLALCGEPDTHVQDELAVVIDRLERCIPRLSDDGNTSGARCNKRLREAEAAGL